MSKKTSYQKRIFNFFSFSKNKAIIFVLFLLFGIFVLYLSKITGYLFDGSKALHVYTYADFISPDIVKEFEDVNNVKVRLKYFDNDNELLAKFKIDKGFGYDVITATDFAIDILRRDGLLHKIDKSKISNLKKLDKSLLNKDFDPGNVYSLPYMWSVYGIIFKNGVINKAKDKVSWDLIFQKPSKSFVKNINNKICMIDTPLESIFLAAIYLFGSIKDLRQEQLQKVENLLGQQKTWVDAYMGGSLQYYLFSEVVNLAVTYSAYAKKVMEVSDDYDFVIPKEGSILAIDSCAIPKCSKKKDLAHRFVNFLLSKKAALDAYDEYGYNPANKKAYKDIDTKFTNNKHLFPREYMFKKLHIMHNQIDPKIVEKLWLTVRLN